MAVVQSFPLFNLPLLAIKEVINYMAPVEQFCFSLISQKSKELVERKHILDLKINGLDSFKSKIICKDENGSILLNNIIDHKSLKHQYKDLKSQKFDGAVVPMKLINCDMITLWENRIEGIQKFMTPLFNIFKIRNFSLNVYMMYKEDVFKILTQFHELKLEFKANVSKIEIVATILNNDIYRYILEKFNEVPELFINSCHTIYQHNNVHPESYCKIDSAKWWTLDDFNFLMKYNSIKLYRLNLTTQEVNLFLKKWMESSTMKNVELTVGNVDYRKAIEKLPVTPQNKLLSLGRWRPQPTECYEIQRNDGVRANLWNNYGDFAMQTYQ